MHKQENIQQCDIVHAMRGGMIGVSSTRCIRHRVRGSRFHVGTGLLTILINN